MSRQISVHHARSTPGVMRGRRRLATHSVSTIVQTLVLQAHHGQSFNTKISSIFRNRQIQARLA
jgi:hypothetical protein